MSFCQKKIRIFVFVFHVILSTKKKRIFVFVFFFFNKKNHFGEALHLEYSILGIFQYQTSKERSNCIWLIFLNYRWNSTLFPQFFFFSFLCCLNHRWKVRRGCEQGRNCILQQPHQWAPCEWYSEFSLTLYHFLSLIFTIKINWIVCHHEQAYSPL